MTRRFCTSLSHAVRNAFPCLLTAANGCYKFKYLFISASQGMSGPRHKAEKNPKPVGIRTPGDPSKDDSALDNNDDVIFTNIEH